MATPIEMHGKLVRAREKAREYVGIWSASRNTWEIEWVRRRVGLCLQTIVLLANFPYLLWPFFTGTQFCLENQILFVKAWPTVSCGRRIFHEFSSKYKLQNHSDIMKIIQVGIKVTFPSCRKSFYSRSPALTSITLFISLMERFTLSFRRSPLES